MAIATKLNKVMAATMAILVVCLILTQQAPFTSLETAPKRIIENRKNPMNYSWPNPIARSEAAACTSTYPLLLKMPTRNKARK